MNGNLAKVRGTGCSDSLERKEIVSPLSGRPSAGNILLDCRNVGCSPLLFLEKKMSFLASHLWPGDGVLFFRLILNMSSASGISKP